MGSNNVARVGAQQVSSAPAERSAGEQRVPLIEVSVDLAAGMTVQMDRCVGDVPVLEVITGRARLTISVDVGDVREVDERDVAFAEQFAAAAGELRDELRRIVAGRRRRLAAVK
ncbi:MAG TPA: hypothetical protein VFC19_13415 [Candidatus Limnocylindrales bacterium]|nr:hypothetical protein [Candidatus Limnocylindrales bacterium]